MPPPRKSPKVAEEALARRIAHERKSRKWSPGQLALQMTAAGCPMTQPTVWKIENAGRRITFDEAIHFAGVFGMSLDELAFPPEVQQAEQAAGLVRSIRWTLESVQDATERLVNECLQLAQFLDGGDDLMVGAVAAAIAEEGHDPWAAGSQEERVAAARVAASKFRHPATGPSLRELVLGWAGSLEEEWKLICAAPVGRAFRGGPEEKE